MVKILFTVCGVGMGHAGRSAMVIKHLKKKHKIKVISYDDGARFLKSKFKVEKLEWFKLFFDKDKYKQDSTIFYNLPKLPRVFFKNLVTLTKIVEEFKPEIVISDFDVNGLYIAKLFNIPSITISNMHISNFVKLKMKLNEKIAYIFNHKTMLGAYSPTDYLFVIYPIKPDKKFKNVEFFTHLVREEFLKAKPKVLDYFLVYSTPTQLEGIVPLLEQIPEQKFVVRGTSGKKQKNVIFRAQFSTKDFVKDLAECKGVICHGGLTVISEAITLKKPVYVFTDKQFFERYYNGKMVQQLGFGVAEQKPSLEGIKKFIEGNEGFRENLVKKNIKPSNKEFLKKLEQRIDLLALQKPKNLAFKLKEVKELIKENKPKEIFKRILKKSDFKRFFRGDFRKFYNEFISENGPKK